MSSIVDLTTQLRRRFWRFWVKRKQEALPSGVPLLSPEKAYREGFKQGYWKGCLDATRVVAGEDQESESGEGVVMNPHRE